MKWLKSKRLIVVLGAHRSGTSLVTRGLKALGVDLGENLMQPVKDDNDRGFWEDVDINNLNIELMDYLGYTWDSMAPIDSNSFQKKDINQFVLRAIELLQKKIEHTEIFGIKDPRMSKLLPFWKEVFNHIDITVTYVICVRNPLSVVKSLIKRNGFSIEKSSYLWLTHIASSIFDSENNTRVFVDYDLIMDNPIKELVRIAHTLDLQFDKDSSFTFEYVDGFIANDLRHTRYTIDTISLVPEIPNVVVRTFEILLKLTRDELASNAEIVSEYFKKLNDEIWEMRQLFEYIEKQEAEIRKQQCIFQQEKKILLEQIICMQHSKFWKLRSIYMRAKWAFYNPFIFLKEYFNL